MSFSYYLLACVFPSLYFLFPFFLFVHYFFFFELSACSLSGFSSSFHFSTSFCVLFSFSTSLWKFPFLPHSTHSLFLFYLTLRIPFLFNFFQHTPFLFFHLFLCMPFPSSPPSAHFLFFLNLCMSCFSFYLAIHVPFLL